MDNAPGTMDAPEAGLQRQRLATLLEAGEERLMRRLLHHARTHGYTRFTSARLEDWRVSIRGLTTPFVEALRSGQALELTPDLDYAADPLAAFGVAEARRHRARGIDMAMFLGLLKYYRQAYQEIAWETASVEDRLPFRTLIDRLFERVEIALTVDWAGESADACLRSLSESNRSLAYDKTRLLAMFENASTPVMIFNDQLALINCNIAAAGLLQRTKPADASPGGPSQQTEAQRTLVSLWRDLPVAQVVPWLADDLEEFLHSGERIRGSEISVFIDGVLRTYQVAFSRLTSTTRESADIVAEISDISSLRLQEREAREGRTLLQRVLDGIGAGIMVIDPADLSFIYCNDRAAAICGRSRAELLRSRLQDIEFLDQRNQPLPHRPMLDSGTVQEEVRLRRPDGAIVPVAKTVVTAPLHGALKLVTVVFDISKQKDMERQLMQSQKLESIGQLAAGIAHEINTPIQYVGGNVEFFETAFAAYEDAVGQLFSSLGSPPDVSEAAQTMERVRNLLAMYRAEVPLALSQTKDGVERVATIVQGIRRFTHPGSGSRRPTDLNKALLATLEVARNEWKRVADTELDLDPSLPPVWCSPGEINQVFLNLVVNASHSIADKVRAQGGKGLLRIETKLSNDKVRISINDTGMGIKYEHQTLVFNPFFTTKSPGVGTGQGLAITHAIIDQHRGSIAFASTPGEGTTFVVHLPVGAPGEKEKA